MHLGTHEREENIIMFDRCIYWLSRAVAASTVVYFTAHWWAAL